MPRSRTSRLVLVTVVAILLTGLVPAVADVLAPPAPEPVPKVAFVARNDNPADALAVGPVAGALGGVLATTPTTELSDEAEATLTAFGPEVVYVAGGPVAITAETYEAIDRAGAWETRRLPGANRDDTARLVATVLDDLGVGRPLLTGAQVVGDAWLGGTLTAEMLEGAVDLPPQPMTWSTRDSRADGTPFTGGLDTILTLEFVAPADGVIAVHANARVTSTDSSGTDDQPSLLLTLDYDRTPGTLLERSFAQAETYLIGAAYTDRTTLSLSSAVPVSAGTHTVTLEGLSTPRVTHDLATLVVSWTPGGEAEPVGLTDAT